MIARFAQAYSRLDAGLARSVWPGVDQDALASAFRGLDSQELVLDRCVVTKGDGDALAECHGTMTYVPRVGSRQPRTERRQWRFRLRPAGDSWQIAEVAVR